MAEYDFSTLNSSDLEELVCDLLNAESEHIGSNIHYRTFKEGKDRGIDILHSSPTYNYEVIGQVKHFYRTGYSKLFKLLADEVKKIDFLKPNKYILATSVDLSVKNAEDIKNLFRPFIKTIEDVYGKKDINRALTRFPKIEESHFKLWFSSTTILQKLLDYKLEGRASEFVESELKKKLRLYVKTPAFVEARTKLQKEKFIIITGEPGVGKTALAELLLYEFIKNDFHLTYIYEDIREINEKELEDDTKRVYYFDDFLGHNSLEISRAKSSESSFIKILRRISRTKNKYFILTTRTFILNTAVQESERLRQFNIKANESILKLSNYDLTHKISLLNNHIEECQLAIDLKIVLKKHDVQDFIIRHLHFSPRSVEYITSPKNIEAFDSTQFEYFIKESFNSPDEIWRHAYEQQINEFDRFLLNTMVTFGDVVDINELEIAFEERLNFEIAHNNFNRPINVFKNAFQRLLGGFIIHAYEENDQLFTFINHSLVDFLIKFIRSSKDEVNRILMSVAYPHQITKRFFRLFENSEQIEMPKKIQSHLLENRERFIHEKSEDRDRINLVFLYFKYFDTNDVRDAILYNLNRIEDWRFLFYDRDIIFNLTHIVKSCNDKIINHAIYLHKDEIFPYLILEIINIAEAFELLFLMNQKYDIDLELFFDQNKNFEWEDHFTNLIEEKIFDDVENLKDIIFSEDEVDVIEEEVIDLWNKFKEMGLKLDIDFSDLKVTDWPYYIDLNNFNRNMDKDD